MPFDYKTNIEAVKQALVDHNTTTASPDLSSQLSTRVKTIEIRDIEVTSLKNSDLPAVFIRVANKEEEYSSLGAPGPSGHRKEANVTYEVFGIYKREGIAGQQVDLLNEAYNLAENLEGVFQAEFTLSNTALWCNPGSTDFSPAEAGQGFFIKTAKVTLTARYHFR